jgi:hypothetical protein
MIACSIAVNSGSNAETMPMRSNSAEEPRWAQKEPIKNRPRKNAQRASHGFIGAMLLRLLNWGDFMRDDFMRTRTRF